MNFVISQELLEQMRAKGKMHLAVEVATSNTSDIEISEIFLRLVKSEFASYLKEKKRYRGYDAGEAEVLLPPYHLEYDETVRFGLKKVLWFRRLTYEGIRL